MTIQPPEPSAESITDPSNRSLRFLLDCASQSSAGGEALKVDLVHAVDQSMPEGCSGFVLYRADQTRLGALQHLEAVEVTRDLESVPQKLRWLLEGVPTWAQRLEVDATFAASGFFSRRLGRTCGVVGTANNMLPFMPSVEGLPESPLQQFRRWMLRSVTLGCLRRADRVILHSRYALGQIEPHSREFSKKTLVVPTGIPTGTRLTTPIPEHPYGGLPYFLYFSPIKPYKNHLNLVEAYRRLYKQVEDAPDLLFAGSPSSEPYLRSIESSIRRLGLEHKVRYLGELPRSSILAWLHHATINLFPSLCETSSMIQCEILGAGGVMAASDVPPMNETPGAATALFDPHDADDICRSMLALWSDPEARQNLRQAALREADNRDWLACGKALWQLASEAHREAHHRQVGQISP
jgi:glycosyltransferase involved in cell wall biosynthesis